MKRTTTITSILLLTMSCSNPFFQEWDTPYGIPPFDQIKEQNYVRAVKIGIHLQSKEIDAIIVNRETPDFENTIAPYERSGAVLDKVSGVLFNLSESDATPAIQKIVDKVIPMLTEHNDNIFMNPYFYQKVKSVHDRQDELGLSMEQKRVVQQLYTEFQNNGVSLDEAGQARMREINKELASLENVFGNHLLAETNAFSLELTPADTAGLTPEILAEAAADSRETGTWTFTLHNPSYVPFMTSSSRRDLREKMFRAYSTRGCHGGENDNRPTVLRIMQLRIEKARLLGYEIPADFILSDKMAANAANVDRFLDKIFKAALRKASEEVRDMQELMDQDVEAGLLPEGSVIRPWDWAYYAEKVRRRKYDLDESLTKPYFKMENVREGVFSVAHEMYGLSFEKLDSIQEYHPDVEGFKVTDADGSLIGILLTDYFPRSTKRGGAWMNNVRNQEIMADGQDIRPIIVNVGNFSRPSAGKPSLLTLDEVETMFHEFGHALHGLLSKCTYKDVSGTNVARDFVEFPSQFNENWAFQPEILASYAKHWKTGESIPDSLVARIRNSSRFNQGFMTTELTAASILDMRWHELTSIHVPADCPFASEEAAPEGAEPALLIVAGKKISLGTSQELRVMDPLKFEEWVMKEEGLIGEIIPRYRTTYFNHIFNSGYNAGYYSYLWAEVLDKDAFEHFQRNGTFNKEIAMSLRRNVLEKGGSEDPMVLYRRFRGQEPDPGALIRARGLE